MTNHEYWQEVASIVDSLIEEGREYKSDEDALQTSLHEVTDGHEWVIYTSCNYEVLQHSDNDGYAPENFGIQAVVTNGVLNTEMLAFGALYGDVSERLYRRVETGCCSDEECEDCGGLGWYDPEVPESEQEGASA